MSEETPGAPGSDSATPTHPPTGRADGVLAGRLHPSVIALWSLRALVPLVAALWATDTVGQAIGMAVVVLAAGASWVRWLRFTWRIDGGGLVIEQGLLQRRRRVIPLERIQAVQAQRSLRHRVFGVVGLRVEAIGGSETEGQLDALAPGVAREVQQALVRRRESGGRVGVPATGPSPGATGDPAATGPRAGDAAAPVGPQDAWSAGADHVGPPTSLTVGEPPPAGTVLAHCPPRQLLVAGLTGGRVGVAAAGLGLAQQVFGEGLTDWALTLPERFGLAVLAALIAVAAVTVFAVSVVATALAFWDFTVRRDGELLRLRRGLLTERRDTVPLRRIQSVTVEQNPVRRAFGLASVSTVVAGRAGDDDGVTATLLPIGDLDTALALAGTVLAAGDVGAVPLRPMPAAARSRRLVRAGWAAAGCTAAAAWLTSWPWAVAVAVATAGVGVPLALAAYRSLGWVRHDALVIARSGVFRRRTTITPAAAAQSVRMSASPFQRRRDLATVRLEIARSGGARDPRLLDLAATDAQHVLRLLAAEASRPTALAPAR